MKQVLSRGFWLPEGAFYAGGVIALIAAVGMLVLYPSMDTFKFIIMTPVPLILSLFVYSNLEQYPKAQESIVNDVFAAALAFTLLLLLLGDSLIPKAGQDDPFAENLALLISLFAWLGLCRAILHGVIPAVVSKWRRPVEDKRD